MTVLSPDGSLRNKKKQIKRNKINPFYKSHLLTVLLSEYIHKLIDIKEL